MAVSEPLRAVNLISFLGLISIRRSKASQGAAEIFGSVEDCSTLSFSQLPPFLLAVCLIMVVQHQVG